MNAAFWAGNDHHAIGRRAADDTNRLSVRLRPSGDDRTRTDVSDVNLTGEKSFDKRRPGYEGVGRQFDRPERALKVAAADTENGLRVRDVGEIAKANLTDRRGGRGRSGFARPGGEC